MVKLRKIIREKVTNMQLRNLIPDTWDEALSAEFEKPYFLELENKINEEYKNHTIFPAKENIFNSISFSKPEDIKVVILGQDPYIKQGQAHGLSFSVQDGIAFPKSLINIFNELSIDQNCSIPTSGCLEKWAEQGVLLLNTILTVRENETNSHINFGWQNFTKEILKTVLNTDTPKVFILWGNQAKQSFASAIDDEVFRNILLTENFRELNSTIKHADKNYMILTAPHPSPLSAYRGFFGSKPFSKTNEFLIKNGQSPIEWRLP